MIVPVVHRLKPVDSLSLTTALYHSQQYAKHVMYAGEPLVYSEGPNNLRNFTPLFERLLYKNIQQKVLNMKTSNSIFTVPRWKACLITVYVKRVTNTGQARLLCWGTKLIHKNKSYREIEEEKSDEEQTEEGGEKVGCQGTIDVVKKLSVFDNILEIFNPLVLGVH